MAITHYIWHLLPHNSDVDYQHRSHDNDCGDENYYWLNYNYIIYAQATRGPQRPSGPREGRGLEAVTRPHDACNPREGPCLDTGRMHDGSAEVGKLVATTKSPKIAANPPSIVSQGDETKEEHP